jgi:phage terminase large subunit GpA-like protein
MDAVTCPHCGTLFTPEAEKKEYLLRLVAVKTKGPRWAVHDTLHYEVAAYTAAQGKHVSWVWKKAGTVETNVSVDDAAARYKHVGVGGLHNKPVSRAMSMLLNAYEVNDAIRRAVTAGLQS